MAEEEGEDVFEGVLLLPFVVVGDEVELIAVEDGERLLRHVASSVVPTVLISDVPPLRP